MADRVEVLISEEEVNKKIAELGAQISKDYEGQEVTLVCILKGAAFFACELAKRITIPLEIEFMRCSSYGNKTESSGDVKITQDLDAPIRGKNIIVVEDIIDSGRTLSSLFKIMVSRGPASLKLCSLLDKPDRRVTEVKVDYTGFEIPDLFVVGYGLDYAQKYRGLPFIGVIKSDEE